jgi:hypothetical protein
MLAGDFSKKNIFTQLSPKYQQPNEEVQKKNLLTQYQHIQKVE